MDWATAVTIIGGVATALIGVVAGSLLTSRTERRHWSRDKQIEACAAVVAESTRIQLALRRAWREGETVDWIPWSVALGTVWMVGTPAVVAAAAAIDEVFWAYGDQFVQRTATSEELWAEARDCMESARLRFINVARLHVDTRHTPLDQGPVNRPSRSSFSGYGSPDLDI
ncbi:hypothetical protein [Streptomyces sp. NPDC017435]|uniref:hypothetical protein n=1 Tax=Streptomyces sp. NPDC017435 TaxID=3364995 RepID=UPI0037877F17